MTAVPVSGTFMVYPKNKTVEPYPADIVGFAWITGLAPGGGPILPPDQVPPIDPPLVIWGGPIDPYPGHPLPEPPLPPVDPPSTPPEKPHEGWNWKPSTPDNPTAGWYYLYVPDAGQAQPKK